MREHMFDEVMLKLYHEAVSGIYEGETFYIIDSLLRKEIQEIINNYDKYLTFGEVMNQNNIQWGFNDEYEFCCHCYKVMEITTQFNGWIPDFWVDQGEFICGDCVRKDFADDYIEFYLLDNFKAVNTVLPESELLKRGWQKYNGIFETGVREGENDSPEDVYNKLKDKYNVIFSIKNIDQFGTEWKVFIK